ncbi:5,6-dimethylbenzimidazole synthase [Aureispira anguillae]|uniref:5,6-dimethylbenzimidazole synthase n=1 Tax=Aureispira anguillae TaxID=2864201 RepID=A0A915YDQ9_9BACT|nr:5,6-dimethylbenzimidazole synthase [Aureispira anguillae]BDS11203.1 5,6-dimethylbenzimidazole synthase [Aureispira anguillae]
MKTFNANDTAVLESILLHRRDVRGNHFLPQPLPPDIIHKILFAGVNAPSVGFSQPWEFVLIDDLKVKKAIRASFDLENQKAANQFERKQDQYQQLKLEGIIEAPLNIAVFYNPSKGPVLGQTSMPEMGTYSVVCAIQNMWLMARSLNVGLGWVSIVDPDKICSILKVPSNRKLVGYLCLGYVDHFYKVPELELLKWEKRKQMEEVIYTNGYNNCNP